MQRLTIIILFILTFWYVLSSPAFAARLALVIGINDYENVTPLKKAVSDAKAISSFLERVGFKTVLLKNPDRRELSITFASFLSSLSPGDEAYLHFSGHGVEFGGRNYLIPADIPDPENKEMIISESFQLDDMVARVAATGAKARIFSIDACRDNPFKSRITTRAIGSGRGLAPVSVVAGTFIFYSAGAGQKALDNLGKGDRVPTSVYTRFYLSLLAKPHVHLGEVARRLRRSVAKAALKMNHEQRPAYYDELSDDYCLVCAGHVAIQQVVEDFVAPIVETPPENVHSYWHMNGSLVELTMKGDDRTFSYHSPRRSIMRTVAAGSVLFKGQKIRNHYKGRIWTFSPSCPSLAFAVAGPITKRGRKIVLYGRKPLRNARSCRVVGHKKVRLVFRRQ